MKELYIRVSPKCCGYTLCVDICPEVFELNTSGFAVATAGLISDDLQGRAIEACESCPQEAIEWSEVPFA